MFTSVGLAHINGTNRTLKEPDSIFASIVNIDLLSRRPWVHCTRTSVQILLQQWTATLFHLTIPERIMHNINPGADLLYSYLDVDAAGAAEPGSCTSLDHQYPGT